jgi:hypothetical protein
MYKLELFTRVRSPYIWQTRKRANEHDIVNLLLFFLTTDPSKCINDQTLRSDAEFCRTSLLKLSDKILPGRSESLQILLTNKFVHKETCVS